MDLQIKRGKVVVKSSAAVQLQWKIKRGKVVVKSATAV
jgi:formylmethanofuran dehydrogenase subunit C